MSTNTKQTVVVYIEPNRIFFYVVSSANTLQIDFPIDVVSNLEIINKEKFLSLVETFLVTNFGGVEVEAIIAFSLNTTFEKDFEIIVPAELETAIHEFIDIVPFDEVLSKNYKLNKKVKLVAINKVFYDVLYDIFQRNKITIAMVYPIAILREVNPDFVNNMDLAQIASKAPSLRQYNLIDVENNNQEIVIKENEDLKKKNKRLYMLLGLFGMLILILFLVAYMTFFNQPPKKQFVPDSLPPLSAPVVTPVESQSTSSTSGVLPVNPTVNPTSGPSASPTPFILH